MKLGRINGKRRDYPFLYYWAEDNPANRDSRSLLMTAYLVWHNSDKDFPYIRGYTPYQIRTNQGDHHVLESLARILDLCEEKGFTTINQYPLQLAALDRTTRQEITETLKSFFGKRFAWRPLNPWEMREIRKIRKTPTIEAIDTAELA